MYLVKNFGRFFDGKFDRAFFSVSYSGWSSGIQLGVSAFFDEETPVCFTIALVKFSVSISFLEIVF